MKPCKMWIGSTDRDGYGHKTVNGVLVRVARHEYEKAHGVLPPGVVVRHTCDNRRCYELTHLIPGTKADNSRDMVERGRQCKGEAQHAAKLTEQDVADIRRLTADTVDLSLLFGVSVQTIRNVIARRTWKHVS